MKTCAIVILNFNGEKTMATFLPSVLAHSSHDIYVIDNASTDASIAFLHSTYPTIQLIQNPRNLGFAEGYNKGLEQIEGKYESYILLNSDVEVSPNWDTGLVERLFSKKDFAAIQPKILSWQDKSRFDYAGAGGGFLDFFGYPYCRGRIWDSIETDSGQYDDDILVDWASGACSIFRSAVFHQLGGFDPEFFAHMEEIDLCWRIRKTGWKIGYTGSVKVYHQGGATLDRGSDRKLYLNIRNSLSMIYKNVSSKRFAYIYMVKYLLEHLAAMDYWIKGEKAFAKAIWRGYSDFHKKKNSIQRFRASEDGIPSKSPVESIFWNWKIRGKKSFQDL